ncbi:chemotaxis protein CheA [Methylomonas methanica]|uniref:Chemotaxis protein CheA n=1 Tax=Methylomonas methanica TaxID=421 RepID=A0A177M7D4_METMH|nr:chemotaxis protein CheA [Methylomonas methanica]OAI01648.1 chemotaxis protein CheA [Methylomonas methanica]
MTPLLEQFLSEARDFLEGIGEKLMQLEDAPGDAELMTALFRMVHTLKGNSGLFDFPEMTRVLHAGEDLMDAVRHEQVEYSQDLADRLLDAMDFVGMLCDEVEAKGSIGAHHAADSARLAESLRRLIASVDAAAAVVAVVASALPNALTETGIVVAEADLPPLVDIPESIRMDAYRQACGGVDLHWLDYTPAADCFFQGDDPFFQARGTPGFLWGSITVRQPWPALAELDAYRCVLEFHLLTTAPREQLDEYYRYVPDQVRMIPVTPLFLALPQGNRNGGPVAYENFVDKALGLLGANQLEDLVLAASNLIELSSLELWLSSALRWLLLVMELEPENRNAFAKIIESLRRQSPPKWTELLPKVTGGNPPAKTELHLSQHSLTPEEAEVMTKMLDVQREILNLPIQENWQLGRIKAVAATLTGCLMASGDVAARAGLEAATAMALEEAASLPLLAWLDQFQQTRSTASVESLVNQADVGVPVPRNLSEIQSDLSADAVRVSDVDAEAKFGRRAEDAGIGPKSLKVDQQKIDRLMNLIGEMVVSKNALPYLAGRAEDVFGVRDLSREIKAQYTVINRIAEEMQDAIMQVRMMPVSFVFQRFPRLVRDTSRKLGKEVNLVLVGEDTEADKNVIEALGDPLVHIVRNSLDHGFEQPDERRAVGKPVAGTLTIRASQESDRVVIEIQDDGKGIDPDIVKRKAYQKGIIDEATLERISDQDAINLIFAAGLSTVDVISDLSGRGVGMDVVRTAVEKVNGAISLESEIGKGTRIRLSLPLSMAVTHVMLIESAGQTFGIPMDSVLETVRVPCASISSIKQSLVTVLRGNIVPLKSINALLAIAAPPQANSDHELAVLVVRCGNEAVGLLVDDFRETVDIILKPMTGVLADIPVYAGSALMGDGSVLMVLNIKELLP